MKSSIKIVRLCILSALAMAAVACSGEPGFDEQLDEEFVEEEELVLEEDDLIEKADGCAAGYTKKAVKVTGSAGYVTPCRIATCKPIGSGASLTHINWGTMTIVIDYVYTASSGTAPATACAAAVSSDVWTTQ